MRCVNQFAARSGARQSPSGDVRRNARPARQRDAGFSTETSVFALALEPRYMFDAAGVATAAETAEQADTEAAEDAAQGAEPAEDPDVDAAFAAYAPPADEPRTEIIFVDTSVEGYETLIEGIGGAAEVVLLDADADAFTQIAEHLQGREGIDAVHIVSHGDVGALAFGSGAVNADNLDDYAEPLAAIGAALAETGDIMLYGCNVGADGEGQDFIDALVEATGADIAASSDLTGAEARGGDWTLEAASGDIEESNVDEQFAASGFEGVLLSVPTLTDWADTPPDATRFTNVATLSFDNGWTATAAALDRRTVRVAIANERLEVRGGNINHRIDYIELSAPGANFSLNKFKMATTNTDPVEFILRAYRDGVEVGSKLFNMAGNDEFETFDAPDEPGFKDIDAFRVDPTATNLFGSSAPFEIWIDDIDVGPVNALPVVNVNPGGGATPGLTEGGGPVLIAPDAAITDADNTQLQSMTITLTNAQDGAAERLSFAATLPPGITVDPASTDTTLIFRGAASVAEYEELLQSVRYENASNAPNETSRDIIVTVNDGVSDSAADTVTLSVASVNTPPAVDGVDGETANVVVGGGPQKPEPFANVIVTSSDSANYNGGLVEISQDTGGGAVAALFFQTTSVANGSWGLDGASATAGGDGAIAAGENIAVGGVVIGVVDAVDDGQGGNTLRVAFNANATDARVQTLLRALTYDAPSGPGPRDFILTLDDGDGTANGGDADVTAAFTINVTPLAPSTPELADGADTGVSDTDNLTNQNQPGIRVTGAEGGTIRLLNDADQIIGSGVVSGGVAVITPDAPLADGVNRIRAVLVDGAGNVSEPSGELLITVDTIAPTVPAALDLSELQDSGSSNTDNITNVDMLTFGGSGLEAGTRMKIVHDVDGSGTVNEGDLELGDLEVDAAGSWFGSLSALTDGVYNIIAFLTDRAGNESAASASLTITIDTTAPAAPPAPTLAPGSDTGSADNITSAITPTLTGTAAPNTTIRIVNDADTEVGTAVSDGLGNWTATLSTALAEGVHNLRVIQIDAAGNESDPSAALQITIDTTAPTAPPAPTLAPGSDTGPDTADNVTDMTTPTIAGTVDPDATVTIYIDANDNGVLDAGETRWTTTADSEGDFNFTIPTPLAEGAHKIRVSQTDAAGNESPASGALTVIVDLSAPSTPAVSGEIAVSENVTVAGVIVGTIASTDASPVTYELVGDGGGRFRIDPDTGVVSTTGAGTFDFETEPSVDITVRAVDAMDNVSSDVTLTVTIRDVQNAPNIILQPGGGELTFVGERYEGGPGGDGETIDTLDNVRDVRVSPDGRHVYVVAGLDSALTVFARNADGTLTRVEEFIDAEQGGLDPAINRLHEADSIAISADGRHVYVAGSTDDAITVFARDAATGRLTFVEDYFNGGVDDAGVAIAGLDGINDVIISNDGAYVYGTGFGDNSVVVFSRNAATGGLTFVERLQDIGAGDTTTRFAGPVAVTVSPDNQYVYVSSLSENAVTVFRRNSDGTLSFVADYYDGQTADLDSLAGVREAYVSEDGLHVYAISGSDNAITVFARNADGTLTFVEKLVNNQTDDAGGAIAGLERPFDIVETPGGAFIYVANQGGNSIVIFARDVETGRLTYVDHLEDQDPLRTDPGNRLAFLESIAISPDGSSVYAGSPGDDAVTAFSRDAGLSTITRNFVEDGGPVVLAPDALLWDTNDHTLASLTAVITNRADGADEALALSDAGAAAAAAAGIAVNYDAATGVLTLSGTASVADYRTVLRLIQYDNFSQNPTGGDRSITITASDGDSDSNVGVVTMSVASIPDIVQVDIPDGIYGIGDAVDISVTFDEVVLVDATNGSPSFAIDIGGTLKTVTFVPGSDNDTVLTFRYIVEAGDLDMDGVSWNANALALNSATIRNAAGADASLVLAAGNASATVDGVINAPSIDLDALSDTGESPTDNITNDNTLTLSVNGEAGASATIVIDNNGDGLVDAGDTVVGSVTLDAGGRGSLTTSALADGDHSFIVTQTDTADNASGPSAALQVTVDTVAPTVPAAPDLIDMEDSGSSIVDNITNENAPTLRGSGAEAGATATVYHDVNRNGAVDAGDAMLSEVAVDAAGSWFAPLSALADGVYDIIVFLTDRAGNESGVSGPLTLTVDTTAPAAPPAPNLADASDSGASNTDNITNISMPLITGEGEDGATVTLLDANDTVLGSTIVSGSAWSIMLANPLADGQHVIRFFQTDVAGNQSLDSGTLTITIDTAAPAAPVSAAGLGVDEDISSAGATVGVVAAADATAVTYAFAANGDGGGRFQIDPDTGAVTTIGTPSFDHETEPAITLTVVATDAAGNETTGDVVVTVNDVNEAPVIANGGVLPAIDEGETNPPGAALNAIGITANDPDDSATLEGLAIVGNSADAGTEGVWEYSTDDGANWFAIGAVNDGAGALALSASTLVRFMPTGDFNGAAPVLDFRALDNTYAAGFTNGAARITVDVTGNGGASAISANTGEISAAVGAVNDAPVVAIADNTFTEGDPPRLVDPAATLSDVDSGTLQSLTITLVDTPDGASERISFAGPLPGGITIAAAAAQAGFTIASTGVTLTLIGEASVADYQAALRLLQYENTSDNPDTTDRTITIVANDGESDSLTATSTIAITSIPDIASIDIVDGDYRAGDEVDVIVTFDEAVAVDASGGTPGFALDIGGVVRIALFVPGSDGGNTLTFRYTAQAGDQDTDGISWAANVLALNGGAIRSLSGVDADLAQTADSDPAARIDTDAPAAPTAPVLDGPSPNDTNTTTPTLTGTGEPGATVILFDDINGDGVADAGEIRGAATVDAAGNWSIRSDPLGEGAHNLRVIQTDAAGNASPPSPALTLNVDTIPPPAPSTPDLIADSDTGPSQTDNITDDQTPTFSGVGEAGATVILFNDINGDGVPVDIIGTATVDTNGGWIITAASPLPDGVYMIRAIQTDAAGNNSPASGALAVTIDAEIPAAPSTPVLVGRPNGFTNNGQLELTGTGEPGADIVIFNDINGDGVANAGETLRTTKADTAGNWSITTDTLAEGTYNVRAVQIDAAGNPSPPSPILTVTVDTTPPAEPAPPQIEGAENGQTNNETLTVTGTGNPGDTVIVFDDIDGDGVPGPGEPSKEGVIGPDGTYRIEIGPLAPGDHNIRVIVTDPAGNASTPSEGVPVTIDIDPPAKPEPPQIEGVENGQINEQILTVSGTGNPGDRVIIFDDIDGDGVPDPDEVLKEVTIGPDGTYEAEIGPLDPGDHNIRVVVIDPAGNASQPSDPFPVTIDIDLPAKPEPPRLEGAEDGQTNNETLTFTGAGNPGDRVIIFDDIDGDGVPDPDEVLKEVTIGPDGTYEAEIGPLAPGDYNIRVVVIDPAGNVSQPSDPFPVTIDVSPPAPPGIPTLEGGDSGGVSNETPTLSGRGEPGAEVIIFDDRDNDGEVDAGEELERTRVGEDGTWRLTLGPLAPGDYNIRVILIDPAGNVSAPSDGLELTVEASSAGGVLTLLDAYDTAYGQAQALTFETRAGAALLVSAPSQLSGAALNAMLTGFNRGGTSISEAFRRFITDGERETPVAEALIEALRDARLRSQIQTDLLSEERLLYFFDGGAWRLLNFQITDDAVTPLATGSEGVAAGAALYDAGARLAGTTADDRASAGFAAQMARAVSDFDRDAAQLTAALRDRGRPGR